MLRVSLPGYQRDNHGADSGHVVLSGTGQDLLASAEVRKAYLGEE